MQQFHPIIYSLPDGGASGKTVEASDADEACRKAAASLLELSLPEVNRMFEKGELEVPWQPCQRNGTNNEYSQ